MMTRDAGGGTSDLLPCRPAIVGVGILWRPDPGDLPPGAHTVALDPAPELQPCCLNRTVVVYPLDRLEMLPELLSPRRSELISAGLEAGPARRPALARALTAAGVTRITRIGRAQAPGSPLFHDGRNALAALARFARLERE